MKGDPHITSLRALIAKRDGFYEAQLLDLALAVSAREMSQLVKELEHAMVCEYQIAKDHGQTPFVRLADRASKTLQEEYATAAFEDMGELQLPSAVREALAAVLHAPQPVLHLSSLSKAA